MQKYFVFIAHAGEESAPFLAEQKDVEASPLVRYSGFRWREVPPPTPDPATIVAARRRKGAAMVDMFLTDNFASGIILTAQQSTDMSNAFRAIRELLEAGALPAALVYVRAWPVDAVFSTERKLKYRTELETFLAQEQT